MTTDLSVRASATTLGMLCGGSLRSDGLRIDQTHPAATDGTAGHEALRALAETGRVDWDAIPEIAKRHGASEDEVRMLCAQAQKLWPSIAASFENALSEVELSAEIAPCVFLTGHMDLLAIRGRVARGADWKTGRKDGDYSSQMKSYGTLVLLDNPDIDEVTVTVIWVRESEIENYTMTRADATAWVARVLTAIVEWDGVYRPGSHCQYCPRSHDCAAANAFVRRDVAIIADKSTVARAEAELGLMAPADIVELHRKAALVSGYADRVLAAVKAHVDANGPIVADGIVLQITEENRRELDPLKTWPVLEATGFTDEDFANVVKLSVSKIEKRVAQNAGRGQGAAAVRELKAALEAAEAVQINQVKKLAVRRA
jgi:hypothetical protein